MGGWSKEHEGSTAGLMFHTEDEAERGFKSIHSIEGRRKKKRGTRTINDVLRTQHAHTRTTPAADGSLGEAVHVGISWRTHA